MSRLEEIACRFSGDRRQFKSQIDTYGGLTVPTALGAVRILDYVEDGSKLIIRLKKDETASVCRRVYLGRSVMKPWTNSWTKRALPVTIRKAGPDTWIAEVDRKGDSEDVS